MRPDPSQPESQARSPEAPTRDPSPLGEWTIFRSDSVLLPVFPPQENKFARLLLKPSAGGRARCTPTYPRGHEHRLPEFEVRVRDGRFESDALQGAAGEVHRLVGFAVPSGGAATYLVGALLTWRGPGSDAPSSVDPWVARDEGPGRGPGGIAPGPAGGEA